MLQRRIRRTPDFREHFRVPQVPSRFLKMDCGVIRQRSGFFLWYVERMDFHRKLTSLFELISFFIWQKLRFNDTPMFSFIYLRHFGLCCGDALRGRRGFFTISLIIAHITKQFLGEFIDENGLHSCVKFHFDFCSINYLIAIYIKQGCLF